MKVLGISGSLRADSHNTMLLRAAARPAAARRRARRSTTGCKEIPPFDEDVEHARPDVGAAPARRDRGGRRGPVRHARVQPLDPGPAQERARLGLAAARRPTRCATSRSPWSAPAPACSAPSGPRPSCARCSRAIGARVIDRELPVGVADDAFGPDGSLADPDLALALGGILAELAGEVALPAGCPFLAARAT